MRKDAKNSDKTNDVDDNHNDNNVTGSWDSLHDHGEEHEAVEEEEEEEEDDEQDDSDSEGVDDEAAKKYKPYRNRQLLSPVTKMEARIHLFNGTVGLGITVLPNALSHFGLIYGSFGLILIAVITAHCHHILVKSMYRSYCRRHIPHLSFPECFGYAIEDNFGISPKCTPVIAGFVACLVFLCQLSVATSYVKFIEHAVTESLIDLWDDYEINEVAVKSVLAVPLLLVNSLPTIKDLVYGSIIGCLTSFVAIGLVIYDIGPHLYPVHIDHYIYMSNYSYFVGIALFSTYTLGTVLLLEGNMKKPKVLIGAKGILSQITLAVILVYLVFGFLGVIALQNTRVKRMLMDRLKLSTRLTHNSKSFLTLACFFSHPLVCYEMFEIVWNSRLKMYIQQSLKLRQKIINYIVRVAIVILTVALAFPEICKVPEMVSLSGVLLISVVGIILPSLLHILTSKKHTIWIIVKDALLLFFGISTFIVGISTLFIH